MTKGAELPGTHRAGSGRTRCQEGVLRHGSDPGSPFPKAVPRLRARGDGGRPTQTRLRGPGVGKHPDGPPTAGEPAAPPSCPVFWAWMAPL